MTTRLDEWMTALAAEPADPRLDGLEAQLGRDILARRREARAVRAFAPVRLATIGLALALGVTAGGAAALSTIRTTPPPSPFAAGAQLAPSTLLEGLG